MFQRVVGAVAVLLMLGSGSSFADVPADHYFWQPAKSDSAPRPWAVLLPGTSGLDIFDDHEHYFRAAIWLNERGVDALVIDYHGAIPLIPAAREGPPGDRIATIVADALRTERAEGRMQEYCPGAVIGCRPASGRDVLSGRSWSAIVSKRRAHPCAPGHCRQCQSGRRAARVRREPIGHKRTCRGRCPSRSR